MLYDNDVKERERIQQEEEEMGRKRESLIELEEKALALRERQQQWDIEQEAIGRAEEVRKQRWIVEEDARGRERNRVEALIANRKLAQLSSLEESARAHMDKVCHVMSCV
jgi:hypothetical protein